jgi:hypothetical protein
LGTGFTLRTVFAFRSDAGAPAEPALSASKRDSRPTGPAKLASGVRPRTVVPPPGEEATTERAAGRAPFQPTVDDDAQRLGYWLDEASQWLTRVPDGPLRTELASTLQRYRRSLSEWAYRTPSDTQRSILVHGVQILRRAIVVALDSDPDRTRKLPER